MLILAHINDSGFFIAMESEFPPLKTGAKKKKPGHGRKYSIII